MDILKLAKQKAFSSAILFSANYSALEVYAELPTIFLEPIFTMVLSLLLLFRRKPFPTAIKGLELPSGVTVLKFTAGIASLVSVLVTGSL